MNKEEYVQLHTLLAKLKYELEIEILNISNKEYVEELRGNINAIDDVMKIFIVECE